MCCFGLRRNVCSFVFGFRILDTVSVSDSVHRTQVLYDPWSMHLRFWGFVEGNSRNMLVYWQINKTNNPGKIWSEKQICLLWHPVKLDSHLWLDGTQELEFLVSLLALFRLECGYSCSQRMESWVRGPTPHRNRSGALYSTQEEVREPIFHTRTGQGPYISRWNRSGSLYPTPEQVRGPISHTRTGHGPNIPTPEQVMGPISHTGTGQGSYNPHRNRSAVL